MLDPDLGLWCLVQRKGTEGTEESREELADTHGLEMGKGWKMAPTIQLKQHKVYSPAPRLSVAAWLASTHLKFFPSLPFHPQNQYEYGKTLVGTVPNLCHPQNVA